MSSGLSLWLKADQGTDTTTEGMNIDTWMDQSSNVYFATGGTNTNRPTYITNGNNFNPTVSFNAGTNDTGFTLGSDYIFAPAANSGMHIFAAVEPTNNGPRKFIYDFGLFAGQNVGLALSTDQAVLADG